MNKSKFAALVVSLIGLAAALPAAAQSLYLGGSAGKAQATDGACQAGIGACDRKDTAFSGNLGFMFNQNWGVEFGAHSFGKILETDDGMGNTAEWKSKGADAVVVAALPFSQMGLSDKLSVYGKAGGYYARTTLTSTYLSNAQSSVKQWTYGLGVRYDVFRHLALRAEWQLYNNIGGKNVGMRADLNVFSGGLLLVF